jgi:NADPH-dependent curcumin reductase CurA
MRGWMNDGKSYIPPVGIGEVMRAGGVGRRRDARRGRAPGFARRATLVSGGGLGVQEYCLVPAEMMQAQRPGAHRPAHGHRHASGSTCWACPA